MKLRLIPTFVMAPILTLIFGVYGVSLFGYELSLPVGGWSGGALRNMILPVLVLALPQIAYIARITRGSMIEALHSNYVRTARAKGLSSIQIVLRHAMRAAVLPLALCALMSVLPTRAAAPKPNARVNR